MIFRVVGILMWFILFLRLWPHVYLLFCRICFPVFARDLANYSARLVLVRLCSESLWPQQARGHACVESTLLCSPMRVMPILRHTKNLPAPIHSPRKITKIKRVREMLNRVRIWVAASPKGAAGAQQHMRRT